MATTITLPNGVRIDTTDAVADVVSLLTITHEAPKVPTTTPQPKAGRKVAVAPKGQAEPVAATEPKARPKATKRTTAPKERPARQPKAAQGGKALWASITAAIAEGDYVEARRLAAPKPDTFGVQAEAAIVRHQARSAKPKQAVEAPKPKAEPKAQPKAAKAAAAPKEPKAGQPLVGDTAEGNGGVKAAPLPPKAAAKVKAANAAEAMDYDSKAVVTEPEAPKAEPKARKRNHKADCGCPTCPKGIEARKAKQAPKEPQAQAQPKAAKAPKAAKPAAQEPKADARQVEDGRAEAAEATRVTLMGDKEAKRLLDALDTEGLAKAMRDYAMLCKRNERLGNAELAYAYNECADACHLALDMAKEHLASIVTK